MYTAIILFLLLIKPRSIFVVIDFNSDEGLTEQEFQDEKTMLIKRIEELPKEHSYRFLLSYWNPSMYKFVHLSSKKSKTDIIHELSQKTQRKLPEGAKVYDYWTYFQLVHTLSNLYDSRSKICSFGDGNPFFVKKAIYYGLRDGFLVEIVSVKKLKVKIQNEMVDLSEKKIGRTACLDKVKAFNCDEGFTLSKPKNCYASEKWYKPQCICDTTSLKQYGITQDYPCSRSRFKSDYHYCRVSSCGKRLTERNKNSLQFRCYNTRKSWENVDGRVCNCDIFEIPGVHLDQCNDKSIGESCAYTCEEEDESPKDASIKCTIHGWDKEPVCGKKCNHFSIDHAEEKIAGKKVFNIGEKFKVVCESGFEKKGEEPTCQKTGEWSEHNLSCEIIKCSALEIENSIQNKNGKTEYAVGEKYKVVCEICFEKKGEEPTCQKTGEWTEHKGLICSSIEKIFNYLFKCLLFTLLL